MFTIKKMPSRYVRQIRSWLTPFPVRKGRTHRPSGEGPRTDRTGPVRSTTVWHTATVCSVTRGSPPPHSSVLAPGGAGHAKVEWPDEAPAGAYALLNCHRADGLSR